MTLRILIAGAGIGGLCLAQGLRRAGIDVEVYERDPSSATHQQGYRIRVDDNGGSALERCLPEELFELYLATSNVSGPPRRTSLDHRLRTLHAVEFPATRHTSVNRLTLRQILLGGLGESVRFGKTVTGVTEDGDGVTLRFADGGAATGDVVVGADGVSSVLRAHVAPAATVVDTGTRCVYGRTPLGPDGFPGIPASGFIDVTKPRSPGLVLGGFRTRHPLPSLPGVELDEVDDYLMWCVITSARELDRLPGRDAKTLHAYATKTVDRWHPTVRRILAEADVDATFPITVRTSVRVPAWPTTNVTLLGDAIHTMTPAGGVGANTALRDAAALTDALSAVNTGDAQLRTAIAGYEKELRDYGFAAVENSLRGTR